MVLKRSTRWGCLALVCGCMTVPVFGQGLSESILTLYLRALEDAGTDWILATAGIANGAAFWLFRILAGVQLSLYFAHWILKGKRGVIEFFADFSIRYFWMGILYAVMNYWGGVGGIPQEFFVATGQLLTGLDGMDPAELADQAAGTFLSIFLDPKLAMTFITGGQGVLAVVLFIVMTSYLAMVMRQSVILTKSYFFFGIGPLMLGFGALGITADLADGWVRGAVKCGLELLGLYVGVSLGSALVHQWVLGWEAIGVTEVFDQMLHLIRFAGGMAVWAAVVVTLPGAAASMADGFNMGIARMMRITR